MRTLGNLLWMIFGGIEIAIMWYIIGIILCLTVIGIPFGMQCFKLGSFVLLPFNKKIKYTDKIVPFLGNLLWIVLCGIWISLVSIICGLALCVTIIGIPFGLQCFKFAKMALMPFGIEVKYIN